MWSIKHYGYCISQQSFEILLYETLNVFKMVWNV